MREFFPKGRGIGLDLPLSGLKVILPGHSETDSLGYYHIEGWGFLAAWEDAFI